jgi:hypothetical protein
MANVIKIKNSGTANVVPTSLEYGELAINYADGILFFKDSSNAIISFDIKGVLKVDVSDLAVDVAMSTF